MQAPGISVQRSVSRRRLLRGAAASAIGLPLLEAMTPAVAGRSQPGTPAPKRFVAMCAGLGFHGPHLFPERAGTDYELTPYLSRLKDHREHFTVLSGLSHPNQQGNNGHASELTWLTSAPRPGLAGFRNTVSLDQLIAEQAWRQLDETFFRMSRISITLLAAGATAFTLGVWIAGLLPWWFFERISARLPGVVPTLLLSLALVIMQLAQCTNIYVRAHKKDPFLLAAVVSNISIALLVFVLGRELGATGVALGYLIGVSLVQVPWWVGIWWRTRAQWHTEGAA